jgi:hypothetical protein
MLTTATATAEVGCPVALLWWRLVDDNCDAKSSHVPRRRRRIAVTGEQLSRRHASIRYAAEPAQRHQALVTEGRALGGHDKPFVVAGDR